MHDEMETKRAPCDARLQAAATVLLLAVIVAAGGRALAPLLPDVPDDRTAADARVTLAAYWNVASPAADPDAAPKTQPDP